jgi:uncharacterized membrane protein YbaN (DUF454 family)
VNNPETAPTRSDDVAAEESLGEATPVRRGSWREGIRRKPGIGHLYRAGVFIVGLLFILLGIVLAALPGPLTIPPVLLGLWIWSTEFAWAHRLFESMQHKAREAWEHAKTHRVSSAAITLGGLVLLAAGLWAVQHYDVVERVREAVGL